MRSVLAEERLDTDVCVVQIDTEEDAQRQRYPGSPTIRLDGDDIEGPMAPPVGLACRTYRGPAGAFSPIPAKETIQQAVRAALASQTDRSDRS